jgi:hypothetical protein
MMIVLLIAGIGAVLAGLLAIAFGIPIKEFGFGNTLILVGVIGTCTGMILLGLWLAVRELKVIAQRLRPVDTRARTALPSIVPGAVEPSIAAAGDEEFAFGRDRAATENAGNTPSGAPPPWLDEAASRVRVDAPTAPEVAEPAPVPKPRRNLLFSSTSRKERERAQARGAEPTAPAPPVAPPVPEPEEVPPATFDDAWPKSERARGAEVPPQRRSGNLSRGKRRRPAAGDGAEIRRRRWHGLFAVFRRLDRGADARRHDAVWLDRRVARPSRAPSLNGNSTFAGTGFSRPNTAVLVTAAVMRS